MVTIAERKRIASVVLTTSDEKMIRKIESLIFSKPGDKLSKKKSVSGDSLLEWDELPDTIKLSVERGLAQSKAGKTVSHEEVMKRYKKWLKK